MQPPRHPPGDDGVIVWIAKAELEGDDGVDEHHEHRAVKQRAVGPVHREEDLGELSELRRDGDRSRDPEARAERRRPAHHRALLVAAGQHVQQQGLNLGRGAIL